MTVSEQRKANQAKFIYASDMPTFDVTKPLPPTVQPSSKWEYNFKLSLYGLGGVDEILSAPNLKSGGTEINMVSYLIPNLTRLRPDKFSDEFFVERRLNGFSPGKLKRVENQPWQYIIRYDFSGVRVEGNGFYPNSLKPVSVWMDNNFMFTPLNFFYTERGRSRILVPAIGIGNGQKNCSVVPSLCCTKP